MKATPTSGPVAIVTHKSISIPIYNDLTRKNGKTYTGFRFFYEAGGKQHAKRAKTLAEIRTIALDIAKSMLTGSFAATAGPTLVLTGTKLADYQTLMGFEKQVGDLLVFIHDAVRAQGILSTVSKGTLSAAASHYASSVGTLRPMTVKRAALRYLAVKRHSWSDSYFERAERHVRYFIAQFGSRLIRDITISDIENFMNTYPRRVAAAKAARKALADSRKALLKTSRSKKGTDL